MDVPTRGHYRVDRLQGNPSAASDPHRRKIYGITEDRPRQRDFTPSQAAFATRRARSGFGKGDQWCISAMEPSSIDPPSMPA